MIPDEKIPHEAPVAPDGRVVYHRGPPKGEMRPGPKNGNERASAGGKLAPTIIALLVSFTILLALVLILGLLSVRKLNDVSTQVLDSQRRHSAWVSLLLQVRTSAIRLNAEARLRADENARGGLKPPAMSLGIARDDINKSLRLLDRPPFNQMEKWRAVRSDLQYFLEITRDLDIYSSAGFQQFRKVDDELNDLLVNDMRKDDDEILQAGENLQTAAIKNIYVLTLSALIAGALVAGGTMLEVQGRFRQMQESLRIARRERHFSRQMLEGMVSGVASIDARERIKSANATFLEIFPNLRVGGPLRDESLLPAVLHMFEAVTASRVTTATYRGRQQLASIGRHSAERTFDFYSSPLDIDGERGQIITLVDVTEAHRAEAELRRTEALRAVGQASAQVAHEIRNPLGSIRLGVSMLRDATTDRDALRTIHLIERGIHHLNKLVIDVTRFSRQKPLEKADVGLNELIAGSLELVESLIKEKQIHVEKSLTPQEVHGNWDEDQLRQVFVNLLANAIDASEQQGRVEVITERLGGERKVGNAPQARATIRDEGSGIDEATREQIFEPFFTTKKKGTGLGLAIVKQIVEQHDGTITVETSPQKGTCFIVDLPTKG